jgi:hypothetical protein
VTVYVLHVVDREKGLLKTRPRTEPANFDFLFEVLAGPHAGRRGSHREISDFCCDQVSILSHKVALCSETGMLLDWHETDETGTWLPRRDGLAAKAVGGERSTFL